MSDDTTEQADAVTPVYDPHAAMAAALAVHCMNPPEGGCAATGHYGQAARVLELLVEWGWELRPEGTGL